MGICTGMAYAEKIRRTDTVIYTVLSDGEMQEGSTWEAMMMAANLGLGNLVALLDLNDFQGLGRTSETHPHFYPVVDKVRAFGWEVGGSERARCRRCPRRGHGRGAASSRSSSSARR